MVPFQAVRFSGGKSGGCTNDAGLEKIELAAIVHMSLYELGDLAHRLSVGPVGGNGGADGGLVFNDAMAETVGDTFELGGTSRPRR